MVGSLGRGPFPYNREIKSQRSKINNHLPMGGAGGGGCRSCCSSCCCTSCTGCSSVFSSAELELVELRSNDELAPSDDSDEAAEDLCRKLPSFFQIRVVHGGAPSAISCSTFSFLQEMTDFSLVMVRRVRQLRCRRLPYSPRRHCPCQRRFLTRTGMVCAGRAATFPAPP